MLQPSKLEQKDTLGNEGGSSCWSGEALLGKEPHCAGVDLSLILSCTTAKAMRTISLVGAGRERQLESNSFMMR